MFMSVLRSSCHVVIVTTTTNEGVLVYPLKDLTWKRETWVIVVCTGREFGLVVPKSYRKTHVEDTKKVMLLKGTR